MNDHATAQVPAWVNMASGCLAFRFAVRAPYPRCPAIANCEEPLVWSRSVTAE